MKSPSSCYRKNRGPFIGCPADADRYAKILGDEFYRTPRPGSQDSIYYWKRNYDARDHQGNQPDQYRIQKTSDSDVNPVFIILRHTIGTAVSPPPEPTGWKEMEQWLSTHGFRNKLALLGKNGFGDIDRVPDGKIPMTGTLFELFEALRRPDRTKTLRIFPVSYTHLTLPTILLV